MAAAEDLSHNIRMYVGGAGNGHVARCASNAGYGAVAARSRRRRASATGCLPSIAHAPGQERHAEQRAAAERTGFSPAVLAVTLRANPAGC